MAIFRIQRVLDETGKSRSGFYADVASGLMPRPIKIGPRASGVPSEEVAAVIRARVAGQDDAFVRILVAQLHAARTSGAPA